MKHACKIDFFAIASLLPALCLLCAAWVGGSSVWVALLSMTVLVVLMDWLALDMEAEAGNSHWLPVTVGVAHLATLGATLWAVGYHPALDTGQKIVLVIATGLFAGQVTNACAHELIHRSRRGVRIFGTLLYCSLLNGQHVSAHLLVHHVHAGTAKDPSSAPAGRGFYRFAARAVLGEFIAGWYAESRKRTISRRGLHPYALYLGGAALFVAISYALGGLWGTVALLVISAHAQMQLFLSDYVQHYGLRRRLGPDNKPEPMGPQHSWNAPHAYSGALMLNAPRHSDHHMNPAREYPDLCLTPATMPVLPHGLPVMGTIALWPPLWRRMMDPKVHAWVQSAAATADTSQPANRR